MTAIVVCSWNVHECVGRDGRRDPARVAAVLDQVGADVAALQEVHSDERGGGLLDQARFLGVSLGMEAVPGFTLERRGGRYGNLLLTRLPVRAARRHDLSVAGREPRGALDVDVDVGGSRLRVVATHLGRRAAERAAQAQHLLERVEAPGPGEGLVVAGDWNEWLPWRTALRRPNRRFGTLATPPTFPAWLPLLALDRGWVAPRGALASVGSHRTRLAAEASDHLPLVLRLHVPRSTATVAGHPGRSG
jgi:endonuclease/exonuclease/phosphatase family metal-dependent hydrolase